MRQIAALVLLLFLAFAYAQNSSPVSESEEAVAVAPPKTSLSSKNVVRSPHHMAWVEKQGNLRIVFLDGKQLGGPHNEVGWLWFSPDEAHLAFIARSTDTWWLVLDGKEQPEQYVSMGGVRWRPGSSFLAYTACREKKKCQLYVNGKASGPEYEEISAPQYSRDGRQLAFIGTRKRRFYAVLDGKETGPAMDAYDYEHWGFSQTGRFYVAGCHECRVEEGRTLPHYGQWLYVVDGEAGPEFDTISPIDFSRDGQHYTYVGLGWRGGWKSTPQSSVVLDGQVKATYDGKKVFYGGMRRGVFDFFPRLAGMSNPVFEPGGKLVYAATRQSGDVAVFVGDEPGQGFTEIVSPIIFSRDAQHFAYVAQQGDNLVEVHDNHPGITFPVPGRHKDCYVDWIYSTSEPNHHLAYELVCGGRKFQFQQTSRALRRMVIDGQPGPEYDVKSLDGLRHTADWKHYGYEIHGAEGDHVRMNIDGKETKVYDDVVSGSLQFQTSAGTASFVVREGDRLVRVTWPLESPKSEKQKSNDAADQSH